MIVNRFPLAGEKIDISECTITGTTLTYTGSAQSPTWTVKYNGKTLVKDRDYTITGTKGTNAASSGSSSLTNYYETFTGIGKYMGSRQLAFNINRRTRTDASTFAGTVTWTNLPTAIAEDIYSAPVYKVTCTITKSLYVYTIDYTKTSSSNTNVSPGTLSGNGNKSMARPYRIYKSRTTATSASCTIYFTATCRSANEQIVLKSSNISLTYP